MDENPYSWCVTKQFYHILSYYVLSRNHGLTKSSCTYWWQRSETKESSQEWTKFAKFRSKLLSFFQIETKIYNEKLKNFWRNMLGSIYHTSYVRLYFKKLQKKDTQFYNISHPRLCLYLLIYLPQAYLWKSFIKRVLDFFLNRLFQVCTN